MYTLICWTSCMGPPRWGVQAPKPRTKPQRHVVASASPWLLGLASIADRENLPDVSVGLTPVDDATAVICIDLEVDRPVRGATVRYSSCGDAPEDRVELGLIYLETKVKPGKRLTCLIEVEGQSVVHVHGSQSADPRLPPRHPHP